MLHWLALGAVSMSAHLATQRKLVMSAPYILFAVVYADDSFHVPLSRRASEQHYFRRPICNMPSRVQQARRYLAAPKVLSRVGDYALLVVLLIVLSVMRGSTDGTRQLFTQVRTLALAARALHSACVTFVGSLCSHVSLQTLADIEGACDPDCFTRLPSHEPVTESSWTCCCMGGLFGEVHQLLSLHRRPCCFWLQRLMLLRLQELLAQSSYPLRSSTVPSALTVVVPLALALVALPAAALTRRCSWVTVHQLSLGFAYTYLVTGILSNLGKLQVRACQRSLRALLSRLPRMRVPQIMCRHDGLVAGRARAPAHAPKHGAVHARNSANVALPTD